MYKNRRISLILEYLYIFLMNFYYSSRKTDFSWWFPLILQENLFFLDKISLFSKKFPPDTSHFREENKIRCSKSCYSNNFEPKNLNNNKIIEQADCFKIFRKQDPWLRFREWPSPSSCMWIHGEYYRLLKWQKTRRQKKSPRHRKSRSSRRMCSFLLEFPSRRFDKWYSTK